MRSPALFLIPVIDGFSSCKRKKKTRSLLSTSNVHAHHSGTLLKWGVGIWDSAFLRSHGDAPTVVAGPHLAG